MNLDPLGGHCLSARSMAEICRRASAQATGFTLPESNSCMRRAISFCHSASAPVSTVSSRLSQSEWLELLAQRRQRHCPFQEFRNLYVQTSFCLPRSAMCERFSAVPSRGPQGLKLCSSCGLGGTPEVVPFARSILKSKLSRTESLSAGCPRSRGFRDLGFSRHCVFIGHMFEDGCSQ